MDAIDRLKALHNSFSRKVTMMRNKSNITRTTKTAIDVWRAARNEVREHIKKLEETNDE